MNKEREEKQKLGTYIPAPYEHVDFHDRHDHESFRFSLWSNRSQFWAYLLIFGKGSFWFLILPSLFAFTVAGFSLKESWGDLADDLILGFYSWLLGVPLFCWALASIVMRYFPKLWVKPSRGPIWE
ncbi:hypothetical protein QN408_25210, partial [Pseudomonas sp. CCI4.2]|nr:hypothetical protein [Pseudomonas sp. CCI4.2]